MKSLAMIFTGIALACFAFSGCDTATKTTNGGSNTSGGGHDDHDHDDHGHDDHDDHGGGHAHGPNSGHYFKFESDEIQGEWKQYPDNNVIKFYVLDAAGKNNMPVKADSISVIPKVGSDKTPFVLVADNPDENGETAVFVLDDQKLKIAIPLGVDIEMKVGEKVYSGEIAAHEPLDH